MNPSKRMFRTDWVNPTLWISHISDSLDITPVSCPVSQELLDVTVRHNLFRGTQPPKRLREYELARCAAIAYVYTTQARVPTTVTTILAQSF